MPDLIDAIVENRITATDNADYLAELQQAIVLQSDSTVEGVEAIEVEADTILLTGKSIVLSDGRSTVSLDDLIHALKFVEYLRGTMQVPVAIAER